MNKHIFLASAAIVTGSTALTASYASAENSRMDTISTNEAAVPALTEEEIPVFVSEEVVQPLPEPDPEDVLEKEDVAKADKAVADPAHSAKAGSLPRLVASIDVSAPLSREMKCLAGTVYFEARGEPLDGQLAVAKVVMNRAESRQFPSSYCGVVTQRAQFSFVKNGRMPEARRGSKAWQRAKAIARIAHEGLWESKADDSLYFHAKYVSPRWRHSKQARATINSHIFYR